MLNGIYILFFNLVGGAGQVGCAWTTGLVDDDYDDGDSFLAKSCRVLSSINHYRSFLNTSQGYKSLKINHCNIRSCANNFCFFYTITID